MFLTRERFFFFFFFGAVCPTLQREKPNSFGFLSGVYFSTRDWGAIQEITASPSQTLQSCEDTALKSWFAIPESSSLTKKRKEKQKETITEKEMLINVLRYQDRLLDPTSFSCHSELLVPLALCSFPQSVAQQLTSSHQSGSLYRVESNYNLILEIILYRQLTTQT